MNVKYYAIAIALALVATVSCKSGKESSDAEVSQEETKDATADGVFFVNHSDGENLASPIIIEMGVNGMTIKPAGEVVEGTGHHHIIIDGSYVEKDQTVPMDATHLHFGKGQTVDTLTLAPGNHTLTLQFANGVHSSYGKDWSKTISISVTQHE
ncbi:MAG: DUF4399 domain-containing protein [Bacteroidia bacterium]|nr:DUF4399 domain-containing protein [Bacteroidia bacterium]